MGVLGDMVCLTFVFWLIYFLCTKWARQGFTNFGLEALKAPLKVL